MGTEQRAISGTRTTLAKVAVGESVAGRKSASTKVDVERIEAFRRLSERHLDSTYRLASAILGNAVDSQDAVHDAFVTAWQKWSSLRDPAKFEPWFRRIVVNTCRDRLREARHRQAVDVAGQTDLAAPDSSLDVEERLQVEQALARLKPDDRILLALRYYHDLKLEDIAELLDVPTGTVKSRLNTAHTRLRSMLERSRGVS